MGICIESVSYNHWISFEYNCILIFWDSPAFFCWLSCNPWQVQDPRDTVIHPSPVPVSHGNCGSFWQKSSPSHLNKLANLRLENQNFHGVTWDTHQLFCFGLQQDSSTHSRPHRPSNWPKGIAFCHLPHRNVAHAPSVVGLSLEKGRGERVRKSTPDGF